MSALKEQIQTAIHWADRCKDILSKDVIEPDERIELETLCAIAIELILWYVFNHLPFIFEKFPYRPIITNNNQTAFCY